MFSPMCHSAFFKPKNSSNKLRGTQLKSNQNPEERKKIHSYVCLKAKGSHKKKQLDKPFYANNSAHFVSFEEDEISLS